MGQRVLRHMCVGFDWAIVDKYCGKTLVGDLDSLGIEGNQWCVCACVCVRACACVHVCACVRRNAHTNTPAQTHRDPSSDHSKKISLWKISWIWFSQLVKALNHDVVLVTGSLGNVQGCPDSHIKGTEHMFRAWKGNVNQDTVDDDSLWKTPLCLHLLHVCVS